MKRVTQLALACVAVLTLASIAAAQTMPTPVVRIGDWVEVGNEVFMNIIATNDWRYQVVHNPDFESDIQDRTGSRSNISTVPHGGVADALWAEIRLGVDMRYQKNLRLRVLLENQMTLDGNMIDNRWTLGESPDVQQFSDGRNLSCVDANGSTTGDCVQKNTWNLERAWIEYSFPHTPVTLLVGAQLWFTDPAGVIGDDDPGIKLSAALGPEKRLHMYAQAIIQTESLRVGLTNDNDDVYYNFGIKYDMQPLVVALDLTWFRFRFQGASGKSNSGQKIDSVLLRPSVTGRFNPISFLLQPMIVLGNADSSDATGNVSHNIRGWAVTGEVEADLNIVRPFIAFLYGSGDDNPADDELRAFSPLPQREITLMTATRYFGVFTAASSWGARDLFPPAAVDIGSGFEFLHTVSNPFSDRVGNGLTPGLSSTYNNPGVIQIAPGVKIFPMKGHELDLYYIFRAVDKTEPIEAELRSRYGVTVDVSKVMTHEIAAMYTWTLNPHFDIRLFGAVVVPGAGAKDIASVQVCNNVTGERCEGKDPALHGELRFRGRF